MPKNKSHPAEKDLANIIAKINDIMRNQFIIDLMIFIQGVNFLIHPEEAHKGIVQALALTVLFAAVGILIGFIVSHGFKRRNLYQIFIAAIFVALSVAVYFNAEHLAPIFHYFLAATIIISGVSNILSAYHITRLNRSKKFLAKSKPDKTLGSISGTLKQSVKIESERILSPAVIFSSKIGRFRVGQLIINLALIIIGFIMFFFRIKTNAILIRVSGGILIFSAISDFIALVWTHRESATAKTFTHYVSRRR